MLLKFKVENFKAFDKEVILNLEADLRTKKFNSNVAHNSQGNALKSIALYGPNNTGKTCFLDAIRVYQEVLLNQNTKIQSNVFSKSTVTKMGAEFLWENKRYAYSFSYDTKQESFLEEHFYQIEVDDYGNKKEKDSFYRNVVMHISKSSDKELNKIMHLSSRDNIMIHSLDTTSLPLLATAKQILKSFAEKINVLSMQSISPSKTMEMLKNEKSKEAKQILKIIQAADLDIDDFYYDRNLVSHDIFDYDKNDMKDKNFRSLNQWLDVLRLVSVKKGKSLPSIIYDSLGTRKIVALSGYLIECLNRGGSLFIDELDSGLHFKLSRSILSLFNNSVNTQAQLIFTTHDASLLDIRTLFRKEQIWFTDRVDEQLFLYSLSAFTAENSGIRLDSSLYDHYSKGLFGALPDPTLIDVLLTNQVGEVDE